MCLERKHSCLNTLPRTKEWMMNLKAQVLVSSLSLASERVAQTTLFSSSGPRCSHLQNETVELDRLRGKHFTVPSSARNAHISTVIPNPGCTWTPPGSHPQDSDLIGLMSPEHLDFLKASKVMVTDNQGGEPLFKH